VCHPQDRQFPQAGRELGAEQQVAVEPQERSGQLGMANQRRHRGAGIASFDAIR
jgi:hypothetical protein